VGCSSWHAPIAVSPEYLSGLSVVEQLVKNISQRSAPRLDSYEWWGVWGSMGKCLGWWASLVFWNFTPEQVQNSDKLVEYLEEVCCLGIPGRLKLLQCVGVWPTPTEPCSTLFSALKGKGGGKTKRQAPWLPQCPSWAQQLNQKTSPCQYQSSPCRKRYKQRNQFAP